MSRYQFLLEILCEEIPANALPSAREQLAARFLGELHEAGLDGLSVQSFSTVRRLVVHVSGLPERQPDREEEVTGPPVRAAFSSDGTPLAAAIGFAKAHGVGVDELRTARTAKGEVIATTRRIAGRPLPELLAEIAESVVASLHFPKRMRWGAGELDFVRPVHGVVALFGAERFGTVVSVSLLGVASGSRTVGHRVTSPGPVELAGVAGLAGYTEALAAAGVIVDSEQRRSRLVAAVAALASEVGCEVREDPALLAELVELVEWPGVVRGTVAERFLTLPEEVLITTLRHHQKSLVLTRGGKLAPFFLAVSDRADDPAGLVQQGNAWVAGARLADAAFFFEHDRRRPLSERGDELARVAFHQKLGSYLDKTNVVEKLAVALARDRHADVAAIGSAARLLKADLVTAMVGEFPELQGVIGGIYARLDGSADAVWQAVYDQYAPAGLDGDVPRGAVGAILGVADRLDTLAGLFGVGEVPTGSKDPFALRRAALAVVKICAEAPLAVSLADAVREALHLRGVTPGKGIGRTLSEFVRERERHYLVTVCGVAGEVAEAVLAGGWGVVPDDVARARALEQVRQEPVFGQLAASFKRVRNIIAKAGTIPPERAPLREPAERDLEAALSRVTGGIDAALGRRDFTAALRLVAELAEPLDRFFNDVLVMCEDEKLRAARFALLARIEHLFLRLADFARLTGQA
jgi:glycyl-tRNA synthetase beta chain